MLSGPNKLQYATNAMKVTEQKVQNEGPYLIKNYDKNATMQNFIVIIPLHITK